MSYKAAIAANALLQRAFKESRPDVTPMKLQKLLWFLNGWHLAMFGKPAVAEPFEVWRYGPVISSLYQQTKKFGGGPVTEYLKTFDEKSGSHLAFVPSDADKEFSEALDVAWEKYIGFNATALSSLTHSAETPWSVAKKNGVEVIDNELIQRYFVGLARPARPAAIAAAV
jgi:uncharacterized phage-associated protein